MRNVHATHRRRRRTSCPSERTSARPWRRGAHRVMRKTASSRPRRARHPGEARSLPRARAPRGGRLDVRGRHVTDLAAACTRVEPHDVQPLDAARSRQLAAIERRARRRSRAARDPTQAPAGVVLRLARDHVPLRPTGELVMGIGLDPTVLAWLGRHTHRPANQSDEHVLATSHRGSRQGDHAVPQPEHDDAPVSSSSRSNQRKRPLILRQRCVVDPRTDVGTLLRSSSSSEADRTSAAAITSCDDPHHRPRCRQRRPRTPRHRAASSETTTQRCTRERHEPLPEAEGSVAENLEPRDHKATARPATGRPRWSSSTRVAEHLEEIGRAHV